MTFGEDFDAKMDAALKRTKPRLRAISGSTPRSEGPDEAQPIDQFNEQGLAIRFANEYANSLRYVAALGKWFYWDKTRWRADETLLARDWVCKVCRDAARACNHAKTSKTLCTAKTAISVTHIAQANRQIAATVDQWDGDSWLINTPSGVVDLRSGQIKRHKPEDYITKITSVAPSGSAPIWLKFLDHITNGNQQLVDYLQRVAGYCLTGSIQEHALFFLYGTGANGKSTFLNAITGAMGDYHRTAPIETFTSTNADRHPTDLAGLRGARLVTAIETEEGRRWAESRIKTLTGGDKIAARFMRQDFFEYTPQFKLIIAGNHKPGLRSVDEAIRRRFNLIPFTLTIPPEERDETLGDKLHAEMPGILAWIIEGCAVWGRTGLNPPSIVTDATAAYLEAEDAVAAWIEDCCERDLNAYCSRAALFRSWTEWATTNGEYVGSNRRFVAALETRSLEPHKRSGERGFKGLRLKPVGEVDEHAVAEAAIAAGLSENDAMDRAGLARFVEGLVERWAARR
jgi:putative DNA primase/helicase